MELDSIYWSILNVLQQNARLSLVEIGRIVGLSAPAVGERIQKLEEAGIIRRFCVDLDLEKLGYTLKAIISFKIHSGKLSSFLKFIEQEPEIYECHRVTGNECLILKVAVKAPKDLDTIVNRLSDYGESTTSVILSTPLDHKIFKK